MSLLERPVFIESSYHWSAPVKDLPMSEDKARVVAKVLESRAQRAANGTTAVDAVASSSSSSSSSSPRRTSADAPSAAAASLASASAAAAASASGSGGGGGGADEYTAVAAPSGGCGDGGGATGRHSRVNKFFSQLVQPQVLGTLEIDVARLARLG